MNLDTATFVEMLNGRAWGVSPETVRGPVVAGCDVRPQNWDLVLLEVFPRGEDFTARMVFSGCLLEPEHVLWVLEQYKARGIGVDSRPEAHLAQRLQVAAKLSGIIAWRMQYSTSYTPIEMLSNTQEMLCTLNRTMTLDLLHYKIVTGAISIPVNFEVIKNGQWKQEMLSSVRAPVLRAGKEDYEWKHVGPDHSFHAMNYALATVKLLNLAQLGSLLTMGVSKGLVERTIADGAGVEIDPLTGDALHESDGPIVLTA